jgi:flagellar biosynthetic protein FlhB
MADDDKSNKTEDPTQRKLDDAHSKGNVVRSQEVSHWAMIGASTLVVALFAGSVMRTITMDMMAFLEAPHAIDAVAAGRLLKHVGAELAKTVGLPIGLLFLAALAAAGLQHKPLLSWGKLAPKFGNLNPMKGIKQKLSMQSLVELAKNLVKLAIVGGVVAAMIWPDRDKLVQIHAVDLAALLGIIEDITMEMLIAIVAVMTVVAAADYLYQWWEHQKNLRMSMQDIKDEHKDSDGDPHVKARIRQIRQERARKRMMAQVPQATVVITNPTHFAVALKYAPEEKMNAPIVVAKGADLIAKRIREIAEENKVPIVENPPLARALFAAADLDQEVPVEHYKAVAEVINYVFRLRGRRAGGARATKNRAGSGAGAPNVPGSRTRPRAPRPGAKSQGSKPESGTRTVQ